MNFIVQGRVSNSMEGMRYETDNSLAALRVDVR